MNVQCLTGLNVSGMEVFVQSNFYFRGAQPEVVHRAVPLSFSLTRLPFHQECAESLRQPEAGRSVEKFSTCGVSEESE